MKNQFSILAMVALLGSVALAQSWPQPKVKTGRFQLIKEKSTPQVCAEVFDLRVEKSAEGDVSVALGSRQGFLWKALKDLTVRQGNCDYVMNQSLSEDSSGQTLTSENFEKCSDGGGFVGSERRTFKLSIKSLSVKIERQKGGDAAPWTVEADCKYRFK